MLYVVAKSRQQAAEYAKARGLDKDDWRFVENVKTLQNVKGRINSLAITATAAERSDLKQVLETARAAGFDV